MKATTRLTPNHTPHATAKPVMSNVPQRSSNTGIAPLTGWSARAGTRAKSLHRRFELGQVQQLSGGGKEKNAAYQELEHEHARCKH